MLWILLPQDSCRRRLLWTRYWVPCKRGHFLEYPKKKFSFWRAVLHGVPRFVNLLGKSHCRAEIQSYFPRISVMSRIDRNSLFTYFKVDIDYFQAQWTELCEVHGPKSIVTPAADWCCVTNLRNSLPHYPIIFCTLTDRPHAILRLVLWTYTAGSIPVVTDRWLFVVQMFCSFFVFSRVHCDSAPKLATATATRRYESILLFRVQVFDAALLGELPFILESNPHPFFTVSEG